MYVKHIVWKTRNTKYNAVNNQQDATTFSSINLFNSALHVSGDKFAHPQEHFLTVRGLLEKYPTFGREKETGLLGALDT